MIIPKMIKNQVMMDHFRIFEKDHTATFICTSNFYTRNQEIYIPRSVLYLDQEYVIAKIEKSFREIKSLTLAEDSEIQEIPTYLLFLSRVEKFNIPPKISKFQQKWCIAERNLTTVVLSPKNPNFKYLDSSQKIILSKSQNTNSNFDTILFAFRDIESVTIPDYIEHIFSNAFDSCCNFKKVEISENSMLKTVDEYAFQYCDFESIQFPRTLVSIKDSAISQNHSIKFYKFNEDSEISMIPSNLFINTSIEKVTIPKNMSDFGFKWRYSKLKTVEISPKNKNLTFLDNEHKIVIGKSNKQSEIFDVLFFACVDIDKKVTIPSNIKTIKDFAFSFCKAFKFIDFDKECKLDQIGNNAFGDTKISSINLPSTKILKGSVFYRCNQLKSFEYLGEIFDANSCLFNKCINLQIISFPNIESISFNINISDNVSDKCLIFIKQDFKIIKK